MTGAAPEGYIARSIPRSVVEAVAQSPVGKPIDVARSALAEHIRRCFDDEPFKGFLNYIVPSSIEYTTLTIPKNRRQKRIYIATQIKERRKFPLVIVGDTGSTPKPYLDSVQNGRVVGHQIVYEYHAEEQINIEIVYAHGDESGALEMRTCLRHILGGIAEVTRTKELEGNTGSSRWLLRIPKVLDPGSLSRTNIGEDNLDTYYMGTFTMTIDFEASTAIAIELGKMSAAQSSSQFSMLGAYSAVGMPTQLYISRGVELVDVPHMPNGMRVISSNPEILSVQILGPSQIQLFARSVGTASVQFYRERQREPSDERTITVQV